MTQEYVQFEELFARVESCEFANKVKNQITQYRKAISEAAQTVENPKLLWIYASSALWAFLYDKRIVPPIYTSAVSWRMLGRTSAVTPEDTSEMISLALEDLTKNGARGLESLTALYLAQRLLPLNIDICHIHGPGGCLKVSFIEPNAVTPGA